MRSSNRAASLVILTMMKQMEHIEISAMPGDDIIVVRQIALEGTARIAAAKRDELCTRYPGFLVDEAAGFLQFLNIDTEAALAVKSGARGVHPLGKGGIFAALWNFAEDSGVGLDIDLLRIPLKQETVEICEFFELNPYQLISGGALLLAAPDGNGVVRAYQEAGIPAVIIGKATASNDRVLLSEGRRRYIDRPKKDEMYKIDM